MRRACFAFGVFAGCTIVLAMLSVEAAAQGAAGDLAGFYYFQGPRVLEIKVAEGEVSTRLWGEQEDLNTLVQQARPGSRASLTHVGKLTQPGVAEFGGFPLTNENIADLLGSVLMTPDQVLASLGKPGGGTSIGAPADYEERWELLPNGRLKLVSNVPILIPAIGPDSLSEAEWAKSRMSQGLSGVLGNYERICGWKIQDFREVQGWRELDNGNYIKAAELFMAVAMAQQDSPFPCIGGTFAMLGQKQFDQARLAIDGARQRLTDETRPFLMQTIYFLEDQLRTLQVMASGNDATDLLNSIIQLVPTQEALRLNFVGKYFREMTPTELATAGAVTSQLGFWSQLEQACQLQGRGIPMPFNQKAFAFSPRLAVQNPNYLQVQLLGDLIKARGDYARSSGDQYLDFALRQYGLAVCIGQKYRHGTLLPRLMGIRVEGRGIRGLENLLEDGAVKEPALLETLCQGIDFLATNEPTQGTYAEFAYENGYPISSNPLLNFFTLLSPPNIEEFQKQANAVRARLALLKAACALKRAAAASGGVLPAILPSEGALEDPFAPGNPIRYRKEGNTAVLYSVGPDGKDDNGSRFYEATSASGDGDIVIRVP